jgi:hypothetical protein
MSASDQKSEAPEIEVTAEMAEAGAKVLRDNEIVVAPYWGRAIAKEMFLAMLKVNSVRQPAG